MKLIHTSDWHFGMPIGTGSYEDSQRYFLHHLYDLIRREQVEAVLCAGDIYDSGVVGADAIALYNDAATTLCGKLGVQLIAIAGNHDSAARLAVCRELLKPAGLHVTGRLEREIQPVMLNGGQVAVYPLPFFGRDEVIALYPEEREHIRTYEEAMALLCEKIRATMNPNCRNILMAHAFVVDAELSESDRSARVGYATAVSKEVFRGFDYVALGHIHKPQIIDHHIRYSGSPIKYSFGSEEQQEKGVVLIDTDTMTQTFVPLPLLRDRKTVTGTYDELITRTDLAGDYLRLQVTDRYPGLELLSDLRQRFPYLLELAGKSLEESESLTALSVEELERMDETDIMLKFMAENFGYDPTEEQLALFREVLAWSQEEGDKG